MASWYSSQRIAAGGVEFNPRGHNVKTKRHHRLGPDSLICKAGVQAIAARLRALRVLAYAARRTPDAERVHALRVSVRRLRSLLGLLDVGDFGRLQLAAKRLQKRLGPLRDTQAELEWLGTRADDVTALRLLRVREERQRATMESLNLGVLDTSQADEVISALARSGRRVGGRRVRRELRQGLKRAQRRLAVLNEDLEPDRVHRARVAVKKVRFQAEVLQSVFPAATKNLLPKLVRLQRELGAVHDADVYLAQAHRFGPRVASRISRFAKTERKRAAKRTRAALKRWHKSGAMKRALEALGRGA